MKERSQSRFTIRAKLTTIFSVGLAIPSIILGIFLSNNFRNEAYSAAQTTLASVNANAKNALLNSFSSAETSMSLLANQVGYNSDFANSILNAKSDPNAADQLKIALSGAGNTGDGSTIIGSMDYLVYSDDDIESATMYSPFVEKSILARLSPVEDDPLYDASRYAAIREHSGQTFWFFAPAYVTASQESIPASLYAWQALVNYGVTDTYDMQVVGYISYRFNQENFFRCLTDTAYEYEGMILFDEAGKARSSVGCGNPDIDEVVFARGASLPAGLSSESSYSSYATSIEGKGLTYVTYVDHSAVTETLRLNYLITVVVVFVSLLVGIVIAYVLSGSIIRRLKIVSKAAGTISNGNYDVRIEKKANDEITDVGESFNIMAGKVRQTLQEMIDTQDAISENFATILETKSGESGHHVKRVSEYSGILAKQMGFSESEVHDIKIGSMLHDVGKIMVPNEILEKPGRLDDEELKIMRMHVAYGDLLLRDVPGNIMQLGAIISAYHHERWDGKGYVKGLKGDEIPRVAQLVSVADVFDALTSRRAYKKAWTLEEAYEEIVRCRGAQFSPEAVDAFIATFDQFKVVAELYQDEAVNDGQASAANS